MDRVWGRVVPAQAADDEDADRVERWVYMQMLRLKADQPAWRRFLQQVREKACELINNRRR